MTVLDFKRRASPAFRRDEPGNVFLRAVTARVIADFFHAPFARVVEECWPSDRALFEIVERASSAPAMTSVAGWAAELVQRVVVDALDALGPASAAAALFRDSLSVAFDGRGIISIPAFVASASNASFVAEGDPIPVRQLATTPGTILPYKIAVIAALTREMIESSNAERLVGDAFVRAAGLALDAVFFGSAAATAAQPAGIRNGIATLTASNSSDPFGAFFEDIATLSNAVSAVAGNGPIAIIGNPGRIASGSMRHGTANTQLHFYGSAAVGADLVAVALSALVSALSPTPEIETAKAAALVMDTAPGAAGTTASGEKSMFQTDSIALKVRWPVTWAVRAPSSVAWLTPAWK